MKFSTKWLAMFVLFIFLNLANCKTEKKVPTRPNIVFIMSDDHAYQAISAYSNRLINTPNIDRIAQQGMLFTNACVTNSICAPSRATILTGKHTHINGKIDNRMPFDTTNVTFPQLLHDAGYQTAMFGKLHFGNNPKGFDEFKILPGQGRYYNPDFITNSGDTTITGYTTDIITDMSLDWLETRREEDKPFLLMYLHKAPHRPWVPAERHYKNYINKEFEEPETLFDTYDGRGTAAHEAEMNLLKHMNFGHDMKIYPKLMKEMGLPVMSDWDTSSVTNMMNRFTDEQREAWKAVYEPMMKDFKEKYSDMSQEELMRWKYKRYMQDYLACIEAVDENVGRLLDYLEDNDLMENTIIVYTSDQGFYLGEHGWFDKRFIYNESFKTPLLIQWPDVIKPGTRNDEMVQNLDFAQTFLEAAGVQAPDDMQGESLMPLIAGEFEKWNRDAVYYHYYEYPAVHMVKRHYGIVTKEYKLVHFYYDVDEWELYDRLSDPKEMTNVYNDPAYNDVVIEMKSKLDELRKKYNDPYENDDKFIKIYKDKGWIK